MSQDSNNKKSVNRNLKPMIISAVMLLVLFGYTIYKGSVSIKGSSYYIETTFPSVFLFLSFVTKIKQSKVRAYSNKNKKNNAFDVGVGRGGTKSLSSSDLDSDIQAAASNVTFRNVAGIEEIKGELEEIVSFLDNPDKYLGYGVRLPKGVLLVGPPGIGKTLIARAVASEADVPFFYRSGANFVHTYVGMGVKKMRELFAKAKQSTPSTIFIDGIDAVGETRSGESNGGGGTALNELLTQMDGFDGESGVITTAATNKMEVLDDALLKAERLNRQVYVSLPNIEDRKNVLELYLKSINREIDIKKLVNEAAGLSSAALATLINEVLLNMIKSYKKNLDCEDIEVAKNKLEFGKRQIKILNDEQKEILAIYQTGKAYASKTKVTFSDENVPKLNFTYPPCTELVGNIKRSLAGFIGPRVIRKEKFVVSSEDLQRSYNLTGDIVTKYKMTTNIDSLLEDVEESLGAKLSQNADEINRLREIIPEDEVITLEDL